MPNKTLYIGPRQGDVWAKAEAMAADAGISVSSLVTRALREFIHRAETGPVPGADTVPPVVSPARQGLDELRRRIAALEHTATHTATQSGTGDSVPDEQKRTERPASPE
jgi:hypothetical protein